MTDHRALFHNVFQPPALNDYHPLILRATRKLLQKLLEDPDDRITHLRQ
jgi:cytochrome P450